MSLSIEYTKAKSLIIPSISGNLLEYYDFSIYGYLAPIISQLFFPLDDKSLSLVATFGVFAVGFLMRPIGALLFGYIGDKAGRKKALAATVILTAISTMAIGLLPTYSQIGAYAGILLIICRLLQGLALGGEFGGAIVYLTEHAPPNRRGLFGSWVMFGTFGGLLLGSAASMLVSNFMIAAWSWRIPFLMSILLGVIGFYLRLYLPETPKFNELVDKKALLKNPIRDILLKEFLTLLKTTGLDFLPAVSFYLVFIYLSSYLNIYFKVPLNLTLLSTTISLLLVVILIPFLGYFSDKVGRKNIMLIGAISFCLFSYPLFILLSQASFFAILISQLLFGVATAFCCAAMPATFTEIFSTKIRYTGVALSYNLANAIFGGTAPLVVTLILHKSTNILAPCFYLILAGFIMLLSIFTIKETYMTKLLD